MPNTKTAAKRMRQNVKRKTINRARKTAIKTFTKRFEKAIDESKPAIAEAELRAVQTKLDKAAGGKTIHPNKAARRKSRLQKKLNQLKAKG